jgi:hypothetical protein
MPGGQGVVIAETRFKKAERETIRVYKETFALEKGASACIRRHQPGFCRGPCIMSATLPWDATSPIW